MHLVYNLTSQMRIPACILDSAVVCTLRVRFELLLCNSVGKSEVHQVSLVFCAFLQAHQDVSAFDVSMDISSTVDVF